MRVAWLVLLVGCGSVNSKTDGSVADSPSVDTPSSCTVHNTVDSCGANCEKCSVTDEREVAACDGTSCGFTCVGGAPKCNDGSCSRLVWDFNDGTLGGAVPVAPNGLQLAVSALDGSPALAMQVTNLTEVQFKVPLCVTGNVDLSSKTLTAHVFFQGGTSAGNQYYVQSSIPAPMNNAFLANIELPSGTTVTYTTPLNMSSFANAATTFDFQAGTLGAQFSGTIFFDDITIQ